MAFHNAGRLNTKQMVAAHEDEGKAVERAAGLRMGHAAMGHSTSWSAVSHLGVGGVDCVRLSFGLSVER
jgi:hypothetical protein